MLKAGLIGYGYWGKILEKYLIQSVDFNLEAIHTSQKHQLKVEEVEDFKNLGIEAVFIAAPTSEHYKLSKQVLEMGMHVFCEKPFIRLNEVQELVNIAKSQQKSFYVNYIYLQSKSVKKFVELCREEKEQEFFDAKIEQYGKFYEGENAMQTLGSHLIAVLASIYKEDIDTKNIDYQKMDQVARAEQLYWRADSKKPNIRLVADLLSQRKECVAKLVSKKSIITFTPKQEHKVSVYKRQNNGDLLLNDTFNFDEGNNINYALSFFYETISTRNNVNNWAEVLKTTSILEKVEDERTG